MTHHDHFLGFGLGLRTQHFEDVLSSKPKVDWFEIISENFMVDGGKPRYYLDAIAEQYPIVMHGVSMSVGSVTPLDQQYLTNLKKLISHVKPRWISDHLCFSQAGNVNSHDLLPMPYTEEAIDHIAARIRQVQDTLGQQMLLENVSSYLTYQSSELSEWDFYNEVCQRADCYMLLDINNIYVSARNHQFNALDYLNAIDKTRVRQIHLAGHQDYGDYVIDTHDHPICDPVWSLYESAVQRLGKVSTMIERDDNIPSLNELVNELDMARKIAAKHIPSLALSDKEIINA
ncbi:DUF692 domain-containing protein [Psychrobium sp. 1_MG-2023]|uniref:MNIO family bufferin maturase n=1 Tax=Psychrobium sp. 1_MG-2023 TaxID=3062624 RepID=UPI000C33B50E|nr:DUF692 domain-containing protein [Psychrobium sp. 1_MG-2023]MDP2561905.1 DUF692 domain-containing protein [Psychrobium sp. 1_MG-2023]PKF59679.1 hypothetical protein CW748_00305 [Alteromonadales bacterium alter-6D02]